MPRIRFSHTYKKFPPNYNPSMLLEVLTTNRDDLCARFVAFDTQIDGGGRYKLPNGKLLVLLLQTGDGALWTTIRRATPAKEEYYRSIRGDLVDIVVDIANQSLDAYQ